MTKKEKNELVEGEDYYSDMFNLLGTEDPDFGLRQVKEKLKGILDGGYIESFNDMELWQLFSTAGLLNRNSKYATVFDKLPKMPRTEKEVKELKEWVKNKDDTSVPLSSVQSASDDPDEEIASGGAGESSDYSENDDALDLIQKK